MREVVLLLLLVLAGREPLLELVRGRVMAAFLVPVEAVLLLVRLDLSERWGDGVRAGQAELYVAVVVVVGVPLWGCGAAGGQPDSLPTCSKVPLNPSAAW